MKTFNQICTDHRNAKNFHVSFENGYYCIWFNHGQRGEKLLEAFRSFDLARAFYVKARDQGVYK